MAFSLRRIYLSVLRSPLMCSIPRTRETMNFEADQSVVMADSERIAVSYTHLDVYKRQSLLSRSRSLTSIISKTGRI